ncbi:hypothetical protein GGX14DRAFT_578638 [Mycena pura]|uniref:Serine/threonine-protein phosphatase 2A activator n=1 Tax=Mycena pura TaxID=153505 RepID=A0AAD6UPI0_9AGAR|nr:hypothetical protein GGX14DRAFT_578638 [Mycena pura]
MTHLALMVAPSQDVSRAARGAAGDRTVTALVVRVFRRYIAMMRVLQSTYWLEPAGSHGVWSLDDYHFLPFLLGAAQLRGHKYVRPRAIHDAEVVEECAKEYIYFACIQFIDSIKTASLRWQTPMLDDISAVKSWDKVNAGMRKMYTAEVLGKLPAMQHFLFGAILPYGGSDPTPADGGGGGHAHGRAHEGWGDCCGIPVPSVFAASERRDAPRSEPSARGSEGCLLTEPGDGVRSLCLGVVDWPFISNILELVTCAQERALPSSTTAPSIGAVHVQPKGEMQSNVARKPDFAFSRASFS